MLSSMSSIRRALYNMKQSRKTLRSQLAAEILQFQFTFTNRCVCQWMTAKYMTCQTVRVLNLLWLSLPPSHPCPYAAMSCYYIFRYFGLASRSIFGLDWPLPLPPPAPVTCDGVYERLETCEKTLTVGAKNEGNFPKVWCRDFPEVATTHCELVEVDSLFSRSFVLGNWCSKTLVGRILGSNETIRCLVLSHGFAAVYQEELITFPSPQGRMSFSNVFPKLCCSRSGTPRSFEFPRCRSVFRINRVSSLHVLLILWCCSSSIQTSASRVQLVCCAMI